MPTFCLQIRSLAIGLVGILAEILINGFGFYAANQEHLGMIKGYLALMGGVAFAWWIRYLTHCTVFAFIAGTWNILHFILICLYYKDLSVVYN